MWGIKEEKQENQEQALVQVKTRKYSATPIKGVDQPGNVAFTMARRTSVDISLDNTDESGEESGKKKRCKPDHEGGCFTCCSLL